MWATRELLHQAYGSTTRRELGRQQNAILRFAKEMNFQHSTMGQTASFQPRFWQSASSDFGNG
jgi:hypothetical protein